MPLRFLSLSPRQHSCAKIHIKGGQRLDRQSYLNRWIRNQQQRKWMHPYPEFELHNFGDLVELVALVEELELKIRNEKKSKLLRNNF